MSGRYVGKDSELGEGEGEEEYGAVSLCVTVSMEYE